VRREPTDPAGGVNRPVGRVQERPLEPADEAAPQLWLPFRGEAVFTQRLVLGLQGDRFIGVVDEPQAARRSECIAREGRHPLESTFRQSPELGRTLRPELIPGDVVRRSTAAQREPTVAPARAAGYLAAVVDTHPQPRLGQRESA